MPELKPRSCRVLIVEDEYFIADELACDLTAAGIEVTGVTKGAQGARDALGTGEVDVVLLDINLSGETSFGLANELRDRGTPFVFITGYDREMLPPQFRDEFVLGKPYDSRGLIDAIRSRAQA